MKPRSAWILVGLGVVAVVVGYWGVFVIVAYFAAGLNAIGAWSLFLGGPLALSGALLALRAPRQSLAAWIGVGGFVLWAVLWLLMLTVLGFEIL